MKRDDKFGSNCPNVNDLIETKINLELYDNYRLYFGLCFLTCFIHLTIYLPFNKKYQKIQPNLMFSLNHQLLVEQQSVFLALVLEYLKLFDTI